MIGFTVKNKMLSKGELLSLGLKSSWIDAVFDAPDDEGPSRHWLNKSGEPLYDMSRVKVACARVGVEFTDLSVLDIANRAKGRRPTSRPIMTFNFHALADIVLPHVSKGLRSLRIAHPVLGRAHDSTEQGYELIDSCLMAMIKACFRVELNEGQVYRFLEGLANDAVKNLGSSMAQDVVVRSAKRRSYISKSANLSAVKRFLYAIALIQDRTIRGPFDDVVDVRRLLSASPLVRFDSTEIRLSGVEGLFSREVCDLLTQKLVEKRWRIFHGTCYAPHGGNEARDEYVIYRGRGSWLLVVELNDLASESEAPASTVMMSTQELLEWAADRDGKKTDQGFSTETGKAPELRIERLVDIANETGDHDCIEVINNWIHSRKPSLPKSVDIRIEGVTGVARRDIWIRTRHFVYQVMTNFGAAYLYPPDLDGFSQLVFVTEPSTSMGRKVKVSTDTRNILGSYAQELEKLKG